MVWAQLGLSLKQNLVMMVTLVARSVLVNTMAALCANLALLTGAKAEPNNYGRGGGGRGQARAGPWNGGGGEPIPAPTELSSTSRTSSATGGSTWTAPWLRSSTPSMTR